MTKPASEPRVYWIAKAMFDVCAENERLSLFDDAQVILKYAHLSRVGELEAQLKEKAESGCCIVEHGWRMQAEVQVKDLQSKLTAALAENKLLTAKLEKCKLQRNSLIRDSMDDREQCRADIEAYNADLAALEAMSVEPTSKTGDL